jgi:hypothetical protein
MMLNLNQQLMNSNSSNALPAKYQTQKGKFPEDQ